MSKASAKTAACVPAKRAVPEPLGAVDLHRELLAAAARAGGGGLRGLRLYLAELAADHPAIFVAWVRAALPLRVEAKVGLSCTIKAYVWSDADDRRSAARAGEPPAAASSLARPGADDVVVRRYRH